MFGLPLLFSDFGHFCWCLYLINILIYAPRVDHLLNIVFAESGICID